MHISDIAQRAAGTATKDSCVASAKNGLVEASCRVLELSWQPEGLLTTIWMALGACLRPSGALLAASGELLDGSWRPLKFSWWFLGEVKWLSWRPMVRRKGFWSVPGELLGPFGQCFKIQH